MNHARMNSKAVKGRLVMILDVKGIIHQHGCDGRCELIHLSSVIVLIIISRH